MLPLLLVFTLAMLQVLQKYPNPASAGLWLLVVLGLHIRRKDVAFLQRLPLFLPALFFVEYLLISIPISIAFIALGQAENAGWLL